MSGKLIVFEGIDGSGKTTIGKDFGLWLVGQRQKAVWATEPNADHIAYGYIREQLSCKQPDQWGLALAFALNRREHGCWIAKRKTEGYTVICDRYLLSSLVYQTLAESICGADVMLLNQGCVVPDLTIVLEISQETQQARMAARGGPTEMFDRLYLQDRYRVYGERLRDSEGHRLVFIDANDSVGTVLARVVNAWKNFAQ